MHKIGIEADISEMLSSFTIVGLPDGEVRESRERASYHRTSARRYIDYLRFKAATA